ncbi:iron-sulfur cluster assembly protein IscA [Candidatus Profftia sp. (ex Adelges kitamiensis)]|uniref:iron-sulfur cluster assembly protein IscA n=1 Tax=Candidatus Profftia sp. (ex Adelges kitamiensis) TaxID=2864218 RepID=UPI001CE36500|nr:iron-sulfur cluster assembly protein IscA [Candidatus Profftia sp. (ex Adelges kitamiensis)]
MSISISYAAAQRIRIFLVNRGKGYGLRLGIKNSGCSGMTYILELIDAPNKYDVVFEDKGIKMIINSNILQYLDGTKLDFVKEGLKESFKFNNPNIISECGCGKSFNI